MPSKRKEGRNYAEIFVYRSRKVREPGYIHFEDIPVCQYNKTIKQELDEGNYTREDLIRIYRDMAICREFEHMLTLIKTQANYNGVETTYPGPAHLSYGQEASCVGEAYLLNKDDITFGSHRSHSEILSRASAASTSSPTKS